MPPSKEQHSPQAYSREEKTFADLVIEWQFAWWAWIGDEFRWYDDSGGLLPSVCMEDGLKWVL